MLIWFIDEAVRDGTELRCVNIYIRRDVIRSVLFLKESCKAMQHARAGHDADYASAQIHVASNIPTSSTVH